MLRDAVAASLRKRRRPGKSAWGLGAESRGDGDGDDDGDDVDPEPRSQVDEHVL